MPSLTDQNKSSRGKKAALIRLGSYLFRHKGYVALAFLLMLSSNLLALLGPSLSAKAINAINLGAGKVEMETVTTNVILMVAVYAASAVMSYLLAVLLVKLGQKITYTLRKEVTVDMYEDVYAVEGYIRRWDLRIVGESSYAAVNRSFATG